MDANGLLTAKEVAEYLGVSKFFVTRLVRSKKIPHVRLSSKTIRFRKEDVDNWVLQYLVDRPEISDFSDTGMKQLQMSDILGNPDNGEDIQDE